MELARKDGAPGRRGAAWNLQVAKSALSLVRSEATPEYCGAVEMQTEFVSAKMPTGRFKSFGPGPKYQVGEPLRKFGDDDWVFEVLLIETGESVEYRLSQIERDPDAQ